jgi:hypothetical protein
MRRMNFVTRLMVINVMIAFLLSVFYFVAGCGASTQQAILNADQQIVTVEQDVCKTAALAGSFIPPGTEASAVAADIQLGCGFASSALSWLTSVVTQYIAGLADAGVQQEGGVVTGYRPAPFLAAKLKALRGH